MATELMVWKVEPGSEAARRLDEIMDKRESTWKEWRAFLSEVGAKNGYGPTSQMVGVKCDGEPKGDGWKTKKREPGVWFPDRRTKAGRELDKRMRSMTMPGVDEITKSMLGSQFLMGEFAPNGSGFYMLRAGMETFGDVRVIKASAHEKWKPCSGLTPMKLSEYHALKEQHEAASAA